MAKRINYEVTRHVTFSSLVSTPLLGLNILLSNLFLKKTGGHVTAHSRLQLELLPGPVSAAGKFGPSHEGKITD